MVLESFFNSIFGSLIAYDPLIALITISFLLTLLITLAYKYLTDQTKIKDLKDELKLIQAQIKENKDNPQKMMELQKLSFQKGFIEMMKHQFKPLIFTLLPILVIFSWLRETYTPLGDLIFSFGWFGVYFITAILFSFLLRKILKVY
jgi:uncharacterized membrane protein (DUF106 family)|tara:strand:- start:2683 stop:3123 length:441 start_codon:yes stop_codon:yes gene_type:complete